MAGTKQHCYRSVLGVTVLVVIVLVVGCIAGKSTSAPDETGAPGSTPGAGDDLATMFPHPEGWDNPASHGAWVVDSGSHDVCLKCHASFSVEEQPIAACNACHSLYPHEEGWVDEVIHGDVFLEKGRSSCATQCHGFDLKGGLSKVGCDDCHATFPHSASWSEPIEHGELAKGDGKNLCKGCHGEDFKTAFDDNNCFSCHQNYPHAANWVEADQHGSFVLENGKLVCATQCHGTDLQGGLSGISCNSCHELYPHSATWLTDHQSAATTLGLDACKDCHGDNLDVILDGKNCFSCHPDYPHPESAIWLPYTSGHGKRVQIDYSQSTTECEKCHGEDLQTLKDGQNCFSCHLSFPHDKKSPVWETFPEHGIYTLTSGKEECAVCHGSAFDGVVSGRTNPSCFNAACHDTYPHLEGWKTDLGVPQEHGIAAYGDGKDSCATANCHGISFEGSANAPTCLDSGCHEDFPHTDPNWVNGAASTHVPVFVAKVNTPGDPACSECHGADYDRDMGGSACTNCHSPVTHKAGWATGTEHGVYYSMTLGLTSADATGAASCTHCHGTAVAFTDNELISSGCFDCHSWLFGSGVLSDQTKAALSAQSACYDCHWAYPHTAYNLNDSGGGIVSGWGPTTNVSPEPFFHNEDEGFYGHTYYLMRSPLFNESDDSRPGMPTATATQYTCGGSAGTCHYFDGASSLRSVTARSNYCGSYCHNP